MNENAELPNAGLEMLDYGAILVYFLITFGIAAWFGRKQKSTEDFFVGGRSMPWLAVGLSILATLFSSISYLAVPGEMIKNGVAMFLGYLVLPLNFLVITRLLVPFFMRLRLTSAYEYLERRFSYPVRLFGATLFILLRLGWMSMVIYVASLALDRVKGGDLEMLPGPDLYWWIAIIGLVAALYTAIGGIQAVIYVDVIQCVLLLAGVLLVIGYVILVDHTTPPQWWREAAMNSPKHTAPALLSWDLTERTVLLALIGNFFWTICTHGSDQVVLQRYFSTSSLAAARRSYIINMIVDVGMAGLLSLAGLALLSFYVRHANLLPTGGEVSSIGDVADKLFPHFLGTQLPAGCAGLIVSAFLCDAIQTLESGVNAITAVIVRDSLVHTKAPDEAVPDEHRPLEAVPIEYQHGTLGAVRRLTVLITIAVTANAYLVAYVQQQHGWTIVDMMPKFFNMFVGPLAAAFFAGMFLPRCTTRSILPAMACGILLSVSYSWFDKFPVIGSLVTRPLTVFLSVAFPCVATLVIAHVLSLFVDRGERHSGSDYTWWAVVRAKKNAPVVSGDGP